MYIKPFKLKITPEEGGDDVFNILLDMGYVFSDGGNIIEYPYIALCLEENNTLYYWEHNYKHYKEDPLREITILDFYEEINSINPILKNKNEKL